MWTWQLVEGWSQKTADILPVGKSSDYKEFYNFFRNGEIFCDSTDLLECYI
jgi:hypothetical protein